LRRCDVFDGLFDRIDRPIEIVILEGDEPLISGSTRSSRKGVFTAPVSAFFGAWRSRVTLSEERLEDHVEARAAVYKPGDCKALSQDEPANVVRITRCQLFRCSNTYTLSWLLHDRTFDTIEDVVRLRDCPVQKQL
jgi:hypothetical protein